MAVVYREFSSSSYSMNERLRELREAEFDAMWHCNAPKETKKILSDIENYQLVIDLGGILFMQ